MFQPFPIDCLDKPFEEMDSIIQCNKEILDTILSIDIKTYDNFMKPLMELSLSVNEIFTPIAHINSVNDSDRSREVFSALIPIVTDYFTDLAQNKDIYNAIQEILKSDLTDLQRKVVEDNIIKFQLSGVHLDDTKKLRIKDISLKLAELADTFSKNLLDSTNMFELVIKDDTSISSMPESDKALAKHDDGSYHFNLQAPSYMAFVTYCDNRELREYIYKAYMTRAESNSVLIEEILLLRKELATILDYKNYAEMNNIVMSAESVSDIFTFLDELAIKAKPHAKKELDELVDYAKQVDIDNLESFDLAYVTNLLKRERLDFIEEKYMPYFESKNVISGLLSFLSKLFNITFKEVIDTPIWHKDVNVYDLLIDNEVYARLYLDIYSRKEKRGGAWMNDWHTYRIDDHGNKFLSSAFIVANFAPPKGDKRSLLKHSDVTTLFHEAGHTIHHLLSRVTEADCSGVHGVEWDAIEFPSQFLENFAYEKSVLEIFAKHYETGEPLSETMIDKLIKNRDFGSAMQLLRQIEFALFDMKIHLDAYSYNQVRDILDKTREDIAVLLPPKYTCFENGFSHIFAGGYASGYYSYKWAEMLSADAYLMFSDAGVFDRDLADRFFNNILTKGASMKMNDLFYLFAKREPDPTALLRLSGLI